MISPAIYIFSILVLGLVKASPPNGDPGVPPDPALTDLQVTRISIDPLVEVCFTVKPADAPDDTEFTLNIERIEADTSHDTEYTMTESSYTPPNNGMTETCVQFDDDVDVVLQKKRYVFGIEGNSVSANTIISGVETVELTNIEIPPTIDGQFVLEHIRFNDDDLSTWKICQGNKQFDLHCATGGPCFAVNADSDSTDPLGACVLTENTAKPVLVRAITMSAPTTPDDNPPVGITLDYTTGSLNPASAKASGMETLVIVEGSSDVYVCRGASCVLEPAYKPADAILDVILITTEDNLATKTFEHSFQDTHLDAVALGDTVMEARWNHHEDEYSAVRGPVAGTTDDSSFHTVQVNCANNNGYCYAYYVDVGAGSFTVTTTPTKDENDDLNQIKSKEVPMNGPTIYSTSTYNYSQLIHVETTATSLSDKRTEIDVCFNDVAKAFIQETHYEFLAISSEGAWKKIFGSNKKDESHACFYALDISSADFNENSKFLILLRDTINGKVLASGEASLDLHDTRAIKPEVDNGSNGSSSTLAILGAAIAGIACLMALVAAAVMFVMKINRNNDGLQYPLHRTSFDDANIIHGLDNHIPTM